MSGGKIITNIESGGFGGGGVYVDSGGSFEMSGGEIASNSGGNGGGMHNKGAFVMLGGRITNNAGVIGGGVCNRGIFTMKGGVIANNKVTFLGQGGGVNTREGTFSMSGGEISYNTAAIHGGGVCVQSGSFVMSGGVISYNKADDSGGGVNSGGGSFSMSGGRITNNKAESDGGMCSDGFTMSNGEISGNTATNSGGGVWIRVDQLDQLFVANGMVFSNNRASISWNRSLEHDAVYVKQIGSSVTWTTPFTQGYNNYDIGYTNNIQMPDITPSGTPPDRPHNRTPFTVSPSAPISSDNGEGQAFHIVALILVLVIALVIVALVFYRRH